MKSLVLVYSQQVCFSDVSLSPAVRVDWASNVHTLSPAKGLFSTISYLAKGIRHTSLVRATKDPSSYLPEPDISSFIRFSSSNHLVSCSLNSGEAFSIIPCNIWSSLRNKTFWLSCIFPKCASLATRPGPFRRSIMACISRHFVDTLASSCLCSIVRVSAAR